VTEPRDQALAALYEIDRLGGEVIAVPTSLPARVKRLVGGVLANREALDQAIAEASEHWRVERMPVLDRALLRMGLYELRYEPDTPTAVIISEAVRMAKIYSTEKSGAFVNGVLGALASAERSTDPAS